MSRHMEGVSHPNDNLLDLYAFDSLWNNLHFTMISSYQTLSTRLFNDEKPCRRIIAFL